MMSIICVYNNEDILEEYLIKSLNYQSEEYELILVDNRLGQFTSASSALNHGAEEANGDYFVFAHQDIYLPDKDWIKNTCKIPVLWVLQVKLSTASYAAILNKDWIRLMCHHSKFPLQRKL